MGVARRASRRPVHPGPARHVAARAGAGAPRARLDFARGARLPAVRTLRDRRLREDRALHTPGCRGEPARRHRVALPHPPARARVLLCCRARLCPHGRDHARHGARRPALECPVPPRVPALREPARTGDRALRGGPRAGRVPAGAGAWPAGVFVQPSRGSRPFRGGAAGERAARHRRGARAATARAGRQRGAAVPVRVGAGRDPARPGRLPAPRPAHGAPRAAHPFTRPGAHPGQRGGGGPGGVRSVGLARDRRAHRRIPQFPPDARHGRADAHADAVAGHCATGRRGAEPAARGAPVPRHGRPRHARVARVRLARGTPPGRDRRSRRGHGRRRRRRADRRPVRSGTDVPRVPVRVGLDADCRRAPRGRRRARGARAAPARARAGCRRQCSAPPRSSRSRMASPARLP